MKEMNLIGLYEKALPSYFTWEEKLSLAKYAGYDFIEMSVDETPERLNRVFDLECHIAEINRAIKNTGAPIISMCLSGNRLYPIGSKSLETREKGIEIIKGAIRLSVGVGIRIIQLAGYDEYYNQSDQITKNYFEKSLLECVEMAAQYSVMLAIETMDTELMGSITNIMEHVDRIKSPWLNIYPDIGNLSSRKVNIREDFLRGRDHIVAIHLKDTRENEFRRVAFGEGIVDFDSFFRLLIEMKYRGPLVVEMWSDDDLGYVAEVKKAREFLMTKIKEAKDLSCYKQRQLNEKGEKYMLDFENYVPVRVVFGRGKLDTLGVYTKGYGKKALIVTTGPFFKQSGLVNRIQQILESEGVKSVYYDKISPNPHSDEAQAGADFARENDCDVIIGLGGGSAIDAAKCIAVAVSQGNDIWPYWMGQKPIYAALPIIAVTTTSGTGSHISSYSVITNPETNEKPGAGSDLLYAKVAIVDPELMLSLPRELTATTGFDVLAHAIEAYTSKSATPFSELYCEKSIKLVGRYLKRAMDEGSDIEAREMMALADTLSGYSIAIAVITMCHAIGHAVGGVCNTVHGVSLAAMTPSAMRHSMSFSPQKYINIGAWLSGYEMAPQNWSLEQSVESVQQFIRDIGMDISLSQQGVKRTDFDEIIEGTISYMGGGCDLDPAAPISADDVRKILEQSF